MTPGCQILDEVRYQYYWLPAMSRYVPAVLHLCGQLQPQTRGQSLTFQYIIWAPFKRMAIDVAGSFPQSDREN
jgi:hypothetical protein